MEMVKEGGRQRSVRACDSHEARQQPVARLPIAGHPQSPAMAPTFLQSLVVRVPLLASFCRSLIQVTYSRQAGGLAGTSVDLLFFPIDTVKTRLQSAQGFANAGGFKGIYKGVGSIIVGSAPGGGYPVFLPVCIQERRRTSHLLSRNFFRDIRYP